MPSPPRSKTFVAACDFVYAGRSYTKGQRVEDQTVVEMLTKYKTRYIAHKAAKAEPPANPTRDAADTPADPPKES